MLARTVGLNPRPVKVDLWPKLAKLEMSMEKHMEDFYLNYVYNVKSDCVHFANVSEQSVELHILRYQVAHQLPPLN